MTDESSDDGIRARLSRQGEDALGRLAQELLESPLVSGALQRTFEARERAAQAQEAAMSALNIPSAADVERLTRRVRSVAQRLEGIEDGVDRLSDRMAGIPDGRQDARLDALEQRLAALDASIAAVAESIAALAGKGEPAPRKQAKRAAAGTARTEAAAERTGVEGSPREPS